jgi:hypothetical protein
VFGTSTARLLRPVTLDRLFGAHFANLAMNSAMAYEQYRLMQVFARHHPQARYLMIGLDIVWCQTGQTYDKYTFREFPEWMYEENRWLPFLKMFNLYSVEQAGLQFSELTGLKPVRYGFDGYENFLPDESKYDPEKVERHLATYVANFKEPVVDDPAALNFPTHPLLKDILAEFPAETRKILYFVPYYVGAGVAPGDYPDKRMNECKRRVAAIAAATPNTMLFDFMIGSGITRDPLNYWDPLHTRVGIAERVATDLADAAAGKPSANGDYRILYP